MTVKERVQLDIRDGGVGIIHEQKPAPCAICESSTYLRYGCCFSCAVITDIGDPRLEGYPRVGGKPSKPS